MDRFDELTRSKIMRAIKSESKIELLPSKYHGMYFRKHQKKIIGSPDYSNKTRKIVLFIDGCFWHGCPLHYRRPKTNQEYWDKKIIYNKFHGRDVNTKLNTLGWKLIRVWECQL